MPSIEWPTFSMPTIEWPIVLRGHYEEDDDGYETQKEGLWITLKRGRLNVNRMEATESYGRKRLYDVWVFQMYWPYLHVPHKGIHLDSAIRLDLKKRAFAFRVLGFGIGFQYEGVIDEEGA